MRKLFVSIFKIHLLCILYLLSGSALYIVSASEKNAVAVADQINFSGNLVRTKIAIRLSQNIKADHFLLEGPNRVVLDLSQVAFAPNIQLSAITGVVDDLRFGQISDDHSRVIITLNQTAIVDRFEIKQSNSGGAVLLVELASVDRETYFQTLAQQKQSNVSRHEIATKGDRINPKLKSGDSFVVMIDPGHGGIDGGASNRRGNIIEKNLTLQLGLKLRDTLNELPGYDVHMTRDRDIFLTLSERVRIARRYKSDLFISLHADSLEQSDVRGATIYTLSKKATDDISKALAASENKVDLVAGLEIPQEDEEVTDILIDLARLETKGFSHRFSQTLLEKMKGKIRLINNPRRGAGFKVLKAPDVTSVLVELGYLSNDADAKLLSKPEWQDKMAEIMVDAISAFRQEKQG